ncbi:DUF2059 domain-containing protein [Chitinophaga arvensicola]|uniref:DUF2059 domain-containing protein n=1 Tax=Chitinophaga arvensicola TaxID=29529 RepID=A0A1I0S879_9BACT|nr:DUF2059 domain-containing protein [Chitinophaga arvensicola]SEW52169.1 hypothetical protein SAMN04488122_4707 [Chitinophaga arvensicola]
MKKLLAVVTFLCLMNNVFSQSASKDQKIKELMEVTGSGKLGAQISHQLMSSFQTQFPEVPAEFWEKAKAQVKPEEIINLSIPIYAKYYTEEEIVELLKFYKTPIGQKVIQVTPQLMTESMEAGRSWGKKLAENIIQELKEKGYTRE